MIYGIGIDIEEIKRFEAWHTKSEDSLQRVFSPQEIEYCLSVASKSAERFAVRYAAREAFYKAYQSACYAYTKQTPTVSFLNMCRFVIITKHDNGIPQCHVDWQALQKGQSVQLPHDNIQVLLSLSHTQTIACANVIIASRD